MITNNICEERKTHCLKVKTSLTGWYFGTYDWALQTLKLLGDDQSVPTAFWTVRFTDRESLRCFILVWPNARRVPVDTRGLDDSELGIWAVPDIVCFQFLRDRGGVVLTPCVKMKFPSREKRAAFRALADH
jgi:hypothetical protein